MTAEYNGGTANGQLYLAPADVNGGMYDGTSSESSEGSPLNSTGYNNGIYSESRHRFLQSLYPAQDPVTAAAMGLIPVEMIPVELDIEGLYDTQDRRRKKSGDGKDVAPHVHSRRRAQNRASQRAFRDRKEKRMKEIEEKLKDLQGRHSALTESYETLQQEYSAMKHELETLRRKQESGSLTERSYVSGLGEWDSSEPESSNPLLFDVSVFCYEPDEKERQGPRD